MGWYNKGTIAIAANSSAVTGTGSLWLDDGIAPGDMLLVGSYTREVLTVNSNTSITLATAITTAVAAGSAYSIAPLGGASTNGAMMTATLTRAIAEALRTDAALLIGFTNLLYSTTPGNVTVTLTDGTQVTVPNWAQVSALPAAMSAIVGTRVDWKGGATWQGTTEATYNATSAPSGSAAAGGDASSTIDVNNVEFLRAALRAYVDAAGANYANLRLTGSNQATTANWYFGANGSLQAPSTLNLLQALAFSSTTFARQTLGNMGISTRDGNKLQIPISTTQAILIQCYSNTATTNTLGAATINYQQTYTTAIGCVICDGDANASSGIMIGLINGIKTTGVDFIARSAAGTPKASATIRVNYIAFGLIDL